MIQLSRIHNYTKEPRDLTMIGLSEKSRLPKLSPKRRNKKKTEK